MRGPAPPARPPPARRREGRGQDRHRGRRRGAVRAARGRVASVVRLRAGVDRAVPAGDRRRSARSSSPASAATGDRLFTVLDLGALLRRGRRHATGAARGGPMPGAEPADGRPRGGPAPTRSSSSARSGSAARTTPSTSCACARSSTRSPSRPVPRAPAFVEGVIRLRGEVIPVLDVRKRLGVPATPADAEEPLPHRERGGAAHRARRRRGAARCCGSRAPTSARRRRSARPGRRASSSGSCGGRRGAAGRGAAAARLRLLLNVKALLDPAVPGEADAARAQAEASRRA